jgi:hypothetical protein
MPAQEPAALLAGFLSTVDALGGQKVLDVAHWGLDRLEPVFLSGGVEEASN